MRRQRWARLVVGVIACGLLSGGCAARSRREGPSVDDLVVEGNHALSDRRIKKRILTSETPVWPWSSPRPFDPIAWQTDLRRIERLYNAHGYYQAKVEGRVEDKPKDDEVEIEVLVEEGKPSHVSAIEIGGLEELPADVVATLQEDLPIVVGEIFSEDRWQALKETLRRRLRDRGHAEATVEGEALVDVDTQQVKLTVVARPGSVYRFGPTEVKRPEGSQVPPAWIADQVKLELHQGDLFSEAALVEAQRRVYSMGVFSVARVSPGLPDPQRGVMPILVETQEAPFRTLRFGGGVGFDQVRNEVRVLSDWTHRNFQGGLRTLRARATLGYALIPTAYAVLRNTKVDAPRHGVVYLAALEFEQPRAFRIAQLRYQASVDSERQLEQAYTAISGRFKTGLVWKPFVDLAILPSYQLSGSHLDAPGIVTPEVAPQTLGCPKNPCFVTLSFLEQTVTFDRRDDPLEPRRGHFESLSVQEGGGPLGGSFDYLRVVGDLRFYLSPRWAEDFTLALRGSAGAIFPRSGKAADTPIQQRFYAGGGVSMRGFNSRRLSPLLAVPASGIPGDTKDLVALPIGGDGLLLTSAELRYRLTDVVTLASFVDGGQVTRDRPEPSDVARMLWAVGGGVRFATPIGSVRLDLAWRLPVGEMPVALSSGGMPVYSEDRSCFGIGGPRGKFKSDGACALHFSIGEAF